MTREQMEAHLTLHGWFVVGTHLPYLAHPDGRWVTSPRDPSTVHHFGRDDSGPLRMEIRGQFNELDDVRFDHLASAVIRRGWA